MNKKILSIFLTALMLISSTTSIFALKKDYSDEAVEDNNIVSAWGNFENHEIIEKFQVYSAKAGIVEGGANGTGHCYMFDTTNTTKRELILNSVPLVAGETYDISFYYRTDTVNVPQITLIHVYEGNLGYGFPKTTSLTTSWQKYTATYQCKGKANAVGDLLGGSTLWFRFGDASSPYKGVYYIDELEIRPRGLVDYDYSVANLVGAEKYAGDNDIRIHKEKENTVSQKVTFSDVNNHWAQTTVETLARYDYVDGMGDGSYAPNASVTRAQFIKMMVGYYGMISPEYKGEYADVKGDEWYVEYLTIARQLGLISPEFYQDGKIYPDKPITREEAATIAAAIAKQQEAKKVEGAVTSFTDDKSISSWALEGVKNAASYGLIKGYDTGDYKPAANITRAEAAAILFRIVELKSKFNIFVDAQNGSDENDGSEAFPLKTMYAARDMAKKLSENMKNDITVNMRGRFRLDETFTLDASDSGKNGYNIIYTSWGNEKATITMADEYSEWEMHDASKNIYKTYVGEGTIARQAWFNDIRGIRAKNIGYLENSSFIDQAYYLCDNKELLDFEHPEDLEFVWHILWCNPRFKVKSISEEDGRVRIDLHDYFGKVKDSKVRFDGDKNLQRQQASFIENAYELLDEQGEYYMNKYDGYMYYIPRIGEDMNNMTVKIAKGEELIKVMGTKDSFVKNVTFDNLKFEGVAWNYVDKVGGLSDLQNNNVAWENGGTYGMDPIQGINFAYVENVNFTNNLVRQMGMHGIVYLKGSKYCNIVGNEVYDIAGGGINVDTVSGGGAFHQRARVDWTEYCHIDNNYVHDTGLDYEDSAGIAFGHGRHTTINHNEVCNVPYSGFHIGYGWARYSTYGSISYGLELNYNYIHDVMKSRVSDGACIYTLGGNSHEGDPKDPANQNRIWNNYLSRGWQCDYVYPDEGSSSWYIKNNVADSEYVAENEHNFDRAISKPKYWTHMHTKTIKWNTYEDNWSNLDYAYASGMMNQTESIIGTLHKYPDHNYPAEAQAVMEAAGIEDKYKDNFDLDVPKVFVAPDRWRNLSIDKPEDAKFMVFGGKDVIYDIQDFYIDFQCEEDAVTYDKATNTLTAHKVGIYEADVMAIINGTVQRQHLLMECGDDIQTIDFGGTSVLLMNGFEKTLTPKATTLFGNTYNVSDSDWTHDLVIDDTSIAKIEGNKITALGNGSTRIHGNIYIKDLTFKFDMPLKVISHSNKEAESLPYTVLDIGKEGGWKVGSVTLEDGGIKVVGLPNHALNQVAEGLIAFDLVVNNGNGWPTIAFCDTDFMGDYNTNDCYMFGFKADHIEFQRWNKGVRTMIFGNSNNPIVGPGVSNLGEDKLYEYGERLSIIMGAIKTDDGTRLVLTINGRNVIDYEDTGSSALKPQGYYVVYNSEPGMVFYPFSNNQSLKVEE